MKILKLCVLFSTLSLFNLNALEQKELQTHISELNRISTQYNLSKDKNRIDQLITNLETFTGRKMNMIEKKFMKAEFSFMDTMPLAEVTSKEITFYEETDKKRENILNMQIVNAEKNIFKYNNIIFELNPEKPIQDNLKVIINGLNTASN